MTMKPTALADLSRPSLLIGAVRFGLASYNREATLRRVVGESAPKVGDKLLTILGDIESNWEDRRTTGAPDYSVSRHVDALTALVAEARALTDQPTSATVTPIHRAIPSGASKRNTR